LIRLEFMLHIWRNISRISSGTLEFLGLAAGDMPRELIYQLKLKRVADKKKKYRAAKRTNPSATFSQIF